MKGNHCLGTLAVCSFVGLVLCTYWNGIALTGDISTTADLDEIAGSATANLSPDRGAALPKLLSRRKRYVAFPEGSSFSVAFCLTVGMVGNPVYTYLSWSTNWGVAYDLPNETWVLNRNAPANLMPRPVVVRRHRRDLYERMETIIDNMGYAGKQCILRALCESTQHFGRKKSNLAVEMVKTIFSLPRTKVLPFEHPDLQTYDDAHRRGRNQANCQRLFPSCTFSLLDFALGQYMRSNSWFQ